MVQPRAGSRFTADSGGAGSGRALDGGAGPPGADSFVRSRFVDLTGPWDQPRVTVAERFAVTDREYADWVEANQLDVVLFDQNRQFREIGLLRRRGIRTIGRFVWESFGPDDAGPATDALDVIYSVTTAERERYRTFGIESPLVRWNCPAELLSVPRPRRDDGEVRFFFPGGYLSDRKPVAEVLEAFRQVRDPRARLIFKAQDPVRGPRLAEEAPRIDPRIRVVAEDLPDGDHHRLMAASDVLLAPTRWEGLGLHHAEAIALGLPAITNDFPPMNESVTHDVDGWLIPARWTVERRPGVPRLETDVGELRDAIEVLADDDRRRRLSLGVSARRARMPWEDTVADLVALLTGTSRGKGPS